MYKLQPREKNHPLFPSNPPLKIEILSTLPLLFENLVGGSTPPLPPPPPPPSRKKWGAHYGRRAFEELVHPFQSCTFLIKIQRHIGSFDKPFHG